MQQRILIADDQQDILDALRLMLKGHGYTTRGVTSSSDLLEALAKDEFDVLLMDLNYARNSTSGQEGLDLLAVLQKNENLPPVVVMTGWATVGLAVEAMQRGVADFVEKPWTNARLLEILQKQITLGRERRELRRRAGQESQEHQEMMSQLQRQKQEIADARAIQQGLLPKEIAQLPGYEIASAWQSALTVGGDYFDILPFSEEALGLCIADVAGKGLSAALLMSNLQAAVRGLASPSCRNMTADRFITFFYAQLDGPTRMLRYASAGHNAPYLLRSDGTHRRLREGGGVLGVFPDQKFELGCAQLAPGDRVILYTDGVTEANDAESEEFGEARLLGLLEENRECSAEELQKRILEAVAEFCGGHWRDDVTLLVLAVS
jgi:sigma-B regulation protein RsbU (phosphoserine phosphatase)